LNISVKLLSYPKGTLVTKYVEDNFLEDTKSGFLKFGTLSSYKAAENQTEARMLDDLEGCRTLLVEEPIYGQTINLPNFKAEYSTFVGNKASIAFIQKFEALVLCLTTGAYDKKHHAAFVQDGNQSVTNYVTFNLHKLYGATAKLFATISDVPAFMIGDEITYVASGKEESTTLSALHASVNTPGERELRDTIFKKPDRFSKEKEFRIAVHMTMRSKFENRNIFVKNYMLTSVAKLFQESVVAHGSFDA